MILAVLASQYQGIKSARRALFSYCDTIKPADLYKPLEPFNNSSIADLLIHNANTYISWINNFGLDGNASFFKTEELKSLNEIRSVFDWVDSFMGKFLEQYGHDPEWPVTATIKHRGITASQSALCLFTHVITHEFHHKGQILTMSRQLGYTPVDTDVIRC